MSTQGRKFDAGKPEFSLLPPYALEAVAKVLTVGAQKYDVDNWKYVPNGAYRYKNAAMRHINDYIKGKKLDDETGLNHLAHAICCLMFMLDADESGVPLAPKKESGVVPGNTTYTIIPQGVPVVNYNFEMNPNVTLAKEYGSTTINLAGVARPTNYMKETT